MLPTVMTIDGLQPQLLTDLQTQLITNATALSPGLTANLPGSLIEDISSTDVAAIALCDQARVELVNSLTPFGANEFILNQLGTQAGIGINRTSNTSVFIVFTSNTPGLFIPRGFTVSDGTNQYVVQDNAIVPASGITVPLFCLSTTSGSFPVPANTVTALVTSVQSPIILTCNNPLAGLPGSGAESIESFRARVLQAGQSSSIGMPTTVRTALQAVPGVQPNLVSMLQQPSGNWSIICGGGDPFAVAQAIFDSMLDISTLVGSATAIRNQVITINDFPNLYTVTYIVPPSQDINITVTWDASTANVVSDTTVTQLIIPAVVAYINNLVVGGFINLGELKDLIRAALAPIIPPQFLTRVVFTVLINDVLVQPTTGFDTIVGDPESFMVITPQAVTVVRG